MTIEYNLLYCICVLQTWEPYYSRLGYKHYDVCNTPLVYHNRAFLFVCVYTMANPTKKVKWKTYLECKECKFFKEVWSKDWYLHNQWYLWVLWRCKECIINWRKREHELQMARVRDRNRFLYNKKRRNDVIRRSTQFKKKYWNIHQRPQRLIRKLWLRPTLCPICYIEPLNKRIEAHHFDYSQPMKIIFACSICHSKLDMWKINYKECNILDLEKF